MLFRSLAHTSFLVFRTVLSVAVARLDGRIVRDLVSADGKGFLKGLGLWFALAVPSTYTNVMVSPTMPMQDSADVEALDVDSPPPSQALVETANPVNAIYR